MWAKFKDEERKLSGKFGSEGFRNKYCIKSGSNIDCVLRMKLKAERNAMCLCRGLKRIGRGDLFELPLHYLLSFISPIFARNDHIRSRIECFLTFYLPSSSRFLWLRSLPDSRLLQISVYHISLSFRAIIISISWPKLLFTVEWPI